PRWQATILPVTEPGANGFRHSVSAGITTGVKLATPAVIEAPWSVSVAPPLACRLRVLSKARFCVLAATVVIQPAIWSTVLAPGPLLPADAATKTPAA